MGIGGHVRRNAIHTGGEIRAMVQVITAQKILIGLAVAGVLGDHHARHRLQRLTRP